MKIVPHLGRATRYVLMSALIGSALGLGVIRFWLMPQAAHYRDWLTSEISRQLGTPVSILELAAGMRGFDPVVALHDFSLLDPLTGQPVLSFKKLRVRLNFLRTLVSGQPVWRSLSLEGAHMVVRRDREGHIGLLGLAGGDRRPDWLLRQGQIELIDIEVGWRDDRTGDNTSWLGRGELRLDNDGDRHELRIALDLPENLGQSLNLAAELRGDVLQPETLQGRVYLAGANLRPGALNTRFDFPLNVQAGNVDLGLWGELREGRVHQLAGRLAVHRTVLSYRAEGGPESSLSLNRLQGSFLWQTTEAGWRLRLNRLQLALLDQAVTPIDMALAYEAPPSGGEPVLRAAVTRVPLDNLRVVLEALPLLGEETQARLRALVPHGELRDVKLVYAAATPHWAVCARFSDFGIQSWRGLPGGAGWSGSLCGDDSHGQIRLATRNSTLNFPKMWPKALRIDAFDGDLDWLQDDASWSISGQNFTVAAPGLNLAGRFRLDVPKDEAGSPFLEARAGLRDVQATAIREYLPVVAMPPLSARWLSEAFDAGRVPRADMLFHGFLRDFPFSNGEGVFQASVQTEGVELDFSPDWPHLYGVDGWINFRGRGMTIDAGAGRIGESRIRVAHAEVGDLVLEDWLAINGEVETTLPLAMQFLSKTPLRRIPERLLKVAEPAGAAEISLNLQVPITEGLTDVKVGGKARLTDAALVFPGLGQKLARIHGDLSFSNEGLDAQGIQAVLLGEPVDIAIDQRAGDILIDANGRVGVKALAQAFPSPEWRRASGQAGYRLGLSIPEAMEASSHPFRVRLNSDLNGLGLDLPAPLGKSERSKRDLSVELSLQQAGKSSVRLAYGDELKAQFSLVDVPKGYQLGGGDVAIGKSLPPSNGSSGIRVLIDLPELNLFPWLAVLNRGATEQKSPSALSVDAFELSVDRCAWGELDLGHLDIRGNKSGELWKGTLDTIYGKGGFELTTPEFAQAKLTLDLETLKWPKRAKAGAQFQAEGEDFDPARLPTLHVRSKQVLWQDLSIGALELDAEHWTQGLNISVLNLNSDNHQLKLKGRWMKGEAGVETTLDGRLDVRDMERLLTELGYAKEIRETPALVRFALKWAGGPQRFSAGRVAGDLDIKFGKGGLLHVEPGLGRIVGMLNLSALSRRLRLDFSDMFGKGLAYDAIMGRFSLEGGQARTSNLLVEAVAANILIDGRAGLVDKDLDMRVAVIPHATVARPITGTLAGVPAVGEAVVFAQRLVGDQVDSITSSHYIITGPWGNPKIDNQPGYMPMDMINRAWSGLKGLSGFGEQEGEQQP